MMEQHLTDAGAERALLAGLFQHGIDAYVEVADIVETAISENPEPLYPKPVKVLQKKP